MGCGWVPFLQVSLVITVGPIGGIISGALWTEVMGLRKGILIYPDILLESWQTFGSCSCLPHCFRSHEENVARMFSFSEHSRTVWVVVLWRENSRWTSLAFVSEATAVLCLAIWSTCVCDDFWCFFIAWIPTLIMDRLETPRLHTSTVWEVIKTIAKPMGWPSLGSHRFTSLEVREPWSWWTCAFFSVLLCLMKVASHCFIL